MQSDSKVIIIGAGVAGLVLAQALKNQLIPFEIFERDQNPSHRGKGWGITFHWALDTFLSLLPQHLVDRLPETYINPEATQNGEDGNFLFFDLATGAQRWRVPPARRIRVRREALRELLMDGIDVQWSKSLSSLDVSECMAYFADGTSAKGSIIIGADGIHSRTRSALLSASNISSPNNALPVRMLGVTVDYGPPLSTKLRQIDPFFFQGGDPHTNAFLYFSFLDTPSSILAREGRQTEVHTCQILIGYPYRQGFLGKEAFDPPANDSDRVKLMKQIGQNWANPFSDMVTHIPDDTEVKVLYLEDWVPKPDMWHSKLRGNVTLVGDAAHAMTMFRGEGANHAITDISVLVNHLAFLLTSASDLQKAIAAYEQEMLARAGPAVLTSRQACLDAHEYARIDENSPLISRRAKIVE